MDQTGAKKIIGVIGIAIAILVAGYLIFIFSQQGTSLPTPAPTPTPTPAPVPIPGGDGNPTSNWVPYNEDGTCPDGYVDYGIPLQCVTPEYLEYCKTNPCPICLAENTLIDTPFGAMPVQKLKKGMPVWTVNASGERVLGFILETGSTRAPITHQVAHLVLSDGRSLYVSPGHPSVDGRLISDLIPGDFYDGAEILSVERVPYRGGATYDILPSGATGFYWANGILLDSTLD